MEVKFYLKKWRIYVSLAAALVALIDFGLQFLTGMIYGEGIYGWMPLITSILWFVVFYIQRQPYITINNNQLIYGFKGNLRYDIESLKLISKNPSKIVLKCTNVHKRPVIKIHLNHYTLESQKSLVSFIQNHIKPM